MLKEKWTELSMSLWAQIYAGSYNLQQIDPFFCILSKFSIDGPYYGLNGQKVDRRWQISLTARVTALSEHKFLKFPNGNIMSE